MNRLTRISATAASVLAGGMLLAPAALADATCTISGNGAGSRNRCTITINEGRRPHGHWGTSQRNTATIKNKVVIISNTGGNDANRNTGGDVSIDTGDVTVDVSITNDVNHDN